MPKNIVICCDGTNNEIVGDQTNVLRLFRMLCRTDKQCIFYDAGVGTQADPTAQWQWQRRIHKKLDGAVGISIRDNVLDAYRFLVTHYGDGDRVFLFGFSRGAYTVRALAGMIYRCGLLWPSFDNVDTYAWSIFSDEDGTHNEKRTFGGAARIKKVFGRRISIHFVGVWDTVSTFGWVWNLLTLPNTAKNPDIQHFRQALSIDERRSCFQPIHCSPEKGQDCQEVWFPGVHADVGGGYPDDEAGLAKAPLEWMLNEAVIQGLEVDLGQIHEQFHRVGSKNVTPSFDTMHDESKKLLWRVQSVLPKRSYSAKLGRDSWQWPNWARRRFINDASFIHSTAIDRMNNADLKYQPLLPKHYMVIQTKPCETLKDAFMDSRNG